MRQFRRKNPDVYRREIAANAARTRALWRLAERHPKEFEQLTRDELAGVWRNVETVS